MNSSERLLRRYVQEPGLLSVPFASAWEAANLNLELNSSPATMLRLELVSRVTTQALLYTHGNETAALKSLHSLFGRTREICAANLDAHFFHAVAWHVLNAHVRPFTSRWHGRWESGRLAALDDADDFRLELASLVKVLRSFSRLLQEMSGQVAHDDEVPERSRVAEEMSRPLPWGLDKAVAGSGREDHAELRIRHAAEHEAIARRREVVGQSSGSDRAVGLALSGGGIRSATFSLGVLDALARRDLLPQFDYVSAVSGGGYAAGFLTNLLDRTSASDAAMAGDGRRLRAELKKPFARGDRESLAIGHVRQNCRYLAAGPARERWILALVQVSGLVTNLIALLAIICLCAGIGNQVGRGVEHLVGTTALWSLPIVCVILAFIGLAVVPAVSAFRGTRGALPDAIMAAFAAPLLLIGAWAGYRAIYKAFAAVIGSEWSSMAWSVATPLAMILVGVGAERLSPRTAFLGRRIAIVAAPAFLFVAGMCVSMLLAERPEWTFWIMTGSAAVTIYLSLLMNVNFTGLHRHYRRRLAHAFLVDHDGVVSPARQLSELCRGGTSPYLILNAALNVPASKQPRMRGRLTDFFSFTPDHCGSPITGYWPTSDMEKLDPAVDLAAAMAISGAAVSPQMGLRNRPALGFWLSILNLRLGYWLRQSPNVIGGSPNSTGGEADGAASSSDEAGTDAEVPVKRRTVRRLPALRYLLCELAGRIDECSKFLNLSDGGHMENLGVYELLRRRCKYIVAVDGEQDETMTFHAVANLQRLAAIDLGVRIDLDLGDLRKGVDGLSRSHFHFSRIHYPCGGIGYLVYLKLSLTGNEGEFLRRFRLDEPAFPHHPTADQNFTEARFEAYRSLGEHVGEKLFLESIVGDLARTDAVNVDAWFAELGRSFLEPLRSPTSLGVP